MSCHEKKLRSVIGGMKSLAIAFSGGLDSTCLAAFSHGILGDRLLLVHVRSPLSPAKESKAAIAWAKSKGIRTLVLSLNPLSDKKVQSNPADRCYHCKKLIMSEVRKYASKHGMEHVADGSNVDDLGDYRPGFKATEELGIIHPLMEAGFGKKQIRILAKRLKLANWNTPSSACLASRIPYGTGLDMKDLARIDKAEDFLRGKGFIGCRVRLITKDSAAIEVAPSMFGKVLSARTEISAYLPATSTT